MAVNLEEYFRTTFEDKLLVKMPEREDDHLTPATRLLEKRREMGEVEQALAAQKEEFQMKMESLQQRREELERKEFHLKESLLKFDKFLKENDSKRTRAEKKAEDESDARRSKDTEISRLHEEITVLTRRRDKMQKKLEKYSMYQKYLDKVLEVAEEFHEIREITARYDTLIATHLELLEKQHKNQDAMEKEKALLNKFIEEKNNENLNYNNQLANLQTELEEAQSDAVEWESKWTHIQNTAAEKTLVLGRIKMATHNLYMLVNKHLKQDVPAESTMDQLTKIQTFIQDLTHIVTEIRRTEYMNTSITGTF
eukprot:gene13932-15384_t